MNALSAEAALPDTRRTVAILFSHTHLHALSTCLSTMYFLPILSLYCAFLSSAEIICSDSEIILPTLDSCARALHELSTWVEGCGASPRDFGPVIASPGVIPLPQYFVDPQINVVKCGIIISWAPRPSVPPPAPLAVDTFYPTVIVYEAARIMRLCAYSNSQLYDQRYPRKLGRAWIQPHQWVLVQFVPLLVNEGNSGDLGSGNGNVTVMVDNGANTTVDASMINPSTCGSPSTLPNAPGNATEAVVAA